MEVNGKVGQLQGENARLRTRTQTLAAEILQTTTDLSCLRQRDLRQWQEQALGFKNLNKELRQEALKWKGQYDFVYRNLGVAAMDEQLKELTAAKEALMDAVTQKDDQIRSLEAQLEAAGHRKDPLSPSVATANSTIADRDRLTEHTNAQLLESRQETDRLAHDNETLRQEIQELNALKSAMWTEGSRLVQVNQELSKQCQDLSSTVDTLSQQGEDNKTLTAKCADLSSALAALSQQGQSGEQVADATQGEHVRLEREVARLTAINVDIEGKLKEQVESREAAMAALRREAKEWIEEREKTLSSKFAAELDEARGSLPAEPRISVNADLEQVVQTLQEEKEKLEFEVSSLTEAREQEETAKTGYFEAALEAESNCEEAVRRFNTLNDEHEKLRENHDALSKLYLEFKGKNGILQRQLDQARRAKR